MFHYKIPDKLNGTAEPRGAFVNSGSIGFILAVLTDASTLIIEPGAPEQTL